MKALPVRTVRLTGIALAAFLFAGCDFLIERAEIYAGVRDKDSGSGNTYVGVQGITLDAYALQLYVGDTAALTATASPQNATDKAISWSSNYPGVAAVDAAGAISAISAGTATITARNPSSGRSANCVVTVTVRPIPVTGVSVNPAAITLSVGDTTTLTAEISPDNASDPSCEWDTDERGIALVDANGRVTAVSPGDARISVRATDGGHVDYCDVTVVDANLASLSLTGSVHLVPAFDPALDRYCVVADGDTGGTSAIFAVSATAVSAAAGVSIAGSVPTAGVDTKNLSFDTTLDGFTVSVTAGSLTKTYRFETMAIPSIVSHWPLRTGFTDVLGRHNAAWRGHPTDNSGLDPNPEFWTGDGRSGIHLRYACNPATEALAPRPPYSGDWIDAEPEGLTEITAMQTLTVSLWVYLDDEMTVYFDGSGPVPDPMSIPEAERTAYDEETAHMNLINKAVYLQYGWQLRYNYYNDDVTLLLHHMPVDYELVLFPDFRATYAGKWTQLTVCIDNSPGDGARATGYVNGEKIGDAFFAGQHFLPVPDAFPTSRSFTGHMSIGAFSHPWGGLVTNGKISDVRLFNALITDADASYLYGLGQGAE